MEEMRMYSNMKSTKEQNKMTTINETRAIRRVTQLVAGALCRNKSIAGALLLLQFASPAVASSFSFSTGDPDGKVATLTRPASSGKMQTETADDFLLTESVVINQATFTGLLPT